MVVRKFVLRASLTAVAIIQGACLVFDGKLGYDAKPGIPCAGTICEGTMSCCAAPGMNASGWFGDNPACSSSTACAHPGFTRLSCATPFDCNVGDPAGNVCCAVPGDNGPQLGASSCMSPDACTQVSGSLVLCDPMDTTPCPGGGSCMSVSVDLLPVGYFGCR
jgi:hypothetical protein